MINVNEALGYRLSRIFNMCELSTSRERREIARRRAEEERAEASFPLRATTK